MILRWKNCLDTAPSLIDVMLGLTYGELDVDLEGERTLIEVHGVPGWLWHLGPLDFARQLWRGDFVSPYSYEEVHKAFIQDWQYDRSGYILVQDARYNPGTLSGPAISLQWNREGINYILISKNRGPMTEDVLLQIADSIAPSKYPSISEIRGWVFGASLEPSPEQRPRHNKFTKT
jgi:hypothetical protein